jgi:uncharacterized BrkB/YihY/UPF0761 family membrane protein
MSRTQAPLAAATPSRKTLQHKLVLIWAVGTMLPLAVLAALYVLAPLPMNAAAAEVLRTANRIAGAVVLVHWGITGAVWAAVGLKKTPSRREAGWQPVKLERRITA